MTSYEAIYTGVFPGLFTFMNVNMRWRNRDEESESMMFLSSIKMVSFDRISCYCDRKKCGM